MRLILLLLPLLSACTSRLMRDAEPGDPPGPEESKVIIYRTSIVSSIQPFPVYDGNRLVGFAEKGRYFEVRCTPGQHLFLSPGFHLDGAVDANLAPGKTYYLRSYPKSDLFAVTGGLKPITNDSREWTTIEKKVGRMKCRELIPEKAIEYALQCAGRPIGGPRPLEALRLQARPLKPEDGK